MIEEINIDGVTIRREGPTKLCSGCGRFMAIDDERVFLPHKQFLKDEWCVASYSNPSKAQIAAEQLRQRLEEMNRRHAEMLGTEPRTIDFVQRMITIVQEHLERDEK